ncbi:hypothetical protein, partial [Pseudarthrobacter sp. B4EP4b]|uniref:hypothetical protein n=1 Tax=Pseudarthrobacter sp. B4EP4b TaxID=2590664 RepID=UPI001C683D40
QPIHKTIGINKLGTLLSSQTTDTPGTTTTTTSHGSLRSNFSKLPAGFLLVKPASATLIAVRLEFRFFRLTLWTSAEINSTTTLPG